MATDIFGQQKDTMRVLEPDQEFYKQACLLMDSSKYKEAIKTFQKAIKANSVFHQAYNKIAFCKVKLGDLSGAEKELQKSLKIQPDDHNTLKYLGYVYLENKKYKEAKYYLDTAKYFLKDEPEVNFLIGRVKLETNDLKGALANFNICIDQKENYGEAYFQRGITHYKIKNYVMALRDITKGFEYLPNDTTNTEAYRARAESAFETGDFKLSVKDYTSILKQEPKNTKALMFRGASKIELNDNSGAIDDESKALDLDKNLYQAYNFRGVAKGGLNSFQEALKDLDMAIKIKADFHSAYVNRASIFYALKQKKKACEDLYKADRCGSNVAYKIIESYCKDQ